VKPPGDNPADSSRGEPDEPRWVQRPRGWRAAVAGAAATVLFAAGIPAGFALDDDTPDRPPDVAQGFTATPDRFMTRLGTEWATFERLRGEAAGSGERYPCRQERQRLDPLQAELDAIGAPDADIRAAAAAYVARLDAVVSLCQESEMTGQQAAKQIRDAQKAWFDVRVKALRVGWDTPCAQRNTVDACAGG
jgi:hypothetical protein